jgi:uncharacterized transporter YbjL
MKAGEIWAWINNTDEGTWQGHLLAGLVFFWPGYLIGAVALDLPGLLAMAAGVLTGFVSIAAVFAYRESDNILAAVRKLGFRLAMRRKGLDGFCDFWFPVFGAAANINLVTGNFGHFLASLVGTEIVWGIVVLYKRNTKKGK